MDMTEMNARGSLEREREHHTSQTPPRYLIPDLIVPAEVHGLVGGLDEIHRRTDSHHAAKVVRRWAASVMMARLWASNLLQRAQHHTGSVIDTDVPVTYDLSDHEDEADGRGDVQFLLGQHLVRALPHTPASGPVAVGADRPLQLDGAGHASVF
ncbi:hypothetical protein INR49_004138 [Caranx melampygus]|nr:hypothetical protein INR49_004138 [Caranx melampygus]